MNGARDDEGPAPTPPEGYVPSEGRGGFSTLNGPYLHRPGDGPLVEQAFYARARHANGVGLVHGGMLSAFMDGVLAGAVWRGAGQRAVTIHLSIDFLHMARVGEWVMGEAEAHAGHQGRGLRRRPRLRGRPRRVRCSGIFKLMNRDR